MIKLKEGSRIKPKLRRDLIQLHSQFFCKQRIREFIFEILRHFPFYNTCTYHLITTMLRVIIIDRRPLFRLCIRVSKKGVSELLETILPDAYACIILPVDTVRILVYWVVQVNIYLAFFLFFSRGEKVYWLWSTRILRSKNYSFRFDKE